MSRQPRTLSILLILSLLTGTLAPLSAPHTARAGRALKSARLAKEPKAADAPADQAMTDILQFSANGHILAFAPDKAYLAGMDHALAVSFVDAQDVTPRGVAEISSVNEETEPSRKAASLGSVSYFDLWKGIDLTYRASDSGIMESIYQVAPGADPGQISLQYNVPVMISDTGNLVFEFENGQMTASAPVAWQEIDGQKFAVDVAFQTTEAWNNATVVSFNLRTYNPNYPLTIDPTYTWHTFFGSSAGWGSDVGTSVVIDGSGNIIVAGTSAASWNGPGGQAPLNAYGGAITVVKMDSNGVYQWHTFYGWGSDGCGGIAVDGAGNIVVAGDSWASWNGPAGQAPLTPNSGNQDIAVLKLDANGAYQWHTFYGAAGSNDWGYGIAVDGTGNVVVTGGSYTSWDGPGPKAPLNTITGGGGITIIKLNSAGGYQWHTFYGSNSGDQGRGVAFDSIGDIFVTGNSVNNWNGSDGQDPLNEHAGGGVGGYPDITVLKLSSAGAYQWHAFYGGSSIDFAYDVTLDADENILVVGKTDFVTWNGPAGQTPLNPSEGNYHLSVLKLDNAGGYQWHTFYPAHYNEYKYDIAVHGTGEIVAVGDSFSEWDGPGGQEPLNPHSGSYNISMVMVDADGNYQWHTFYGSGSARANGVALDSNRNIIVAGSSATWDGPDGQAPLNPHAGGGDWYCFFGCYFVPSSDIVVIKMADPQLPDLTLSKANDTTGEGTVGETFDWEIEVTNSGEGDAIFGGSGVILKDNLPNSGTTYGEPTVTGLAGVDCAITGTTLTCTTDDAITLALGTGFKVSFEVTPSTAGDLVNPSSGGICKVDPDNKVAESEENNNDCTDTVTIDAATADDTGIGDGSRSFSAGSSGGSCTLGACTVIHQIGALPDGSRIVIKEVGAAEGGNFQLGSRVFDIKVYGPNGLQINNFNPAIEVCIKPTTTDLQRAGWNLNNMSLHHQHANGPWTTVVGAYEKNGSLCGQFSTTSYFAVGVAPMPDTGFAPDEFHILPNQRAEDEQSTFDDFWLEIPKLGVDMPIVGVPLTGEGWDVTWLNEQAGYLEGTAFPTWPGNTALTAHVWNADNTPGPFIDLHTLQHGDWVEIHAWGQVYTYEVREVMQVRPDDLRALPQEDYDVLTLITCLGFDESSGEYGWRLAVRAVLIDVE